MWLGEQRGQLSDWLTQRWVQLTGRRVDLSTYPWLAGPVGSTSGIGRSYYERLAQSQSLQVHRDPVGLMGRFSDLAGPDFDPSLVDQRIVHFYERTSQYRLDSWSQWCGAFRPFGWLLSLNFSRRLQQLNMPLSSLESGKGLDSRIVHLLDPATGSVRHIGWVRELRSTKRVAYVGDYSVARIPGHSSPCVRVVFPLPNGNATVVLRPEARPDGSLVLHSSGTRFGGPGFYFVVRQEGHAWARYVPTMRETLHVYVEAEELHTDHVFWIFGLRYLQLHYRLLPDSAQHARGAA